MRKPIRWFHALALVLLSNLLTACGGSLGPPSGELTRAVAFKIQWADSTKNASRAQASALPPLRAATSFPAATRDNPIVAVDANSVQITLPKADRNGNDVVLIATRDTSQGAPEPQTYYPPTDIQVGKRDVRAVFKDTSGKALTEIDTTVNVTTAGGVLTLTTTQQPDRIVVTPGQSVQVSPYKNEKPVILKFVAYIGTGDNEQVVAVNPLNVNITVPDGANLLQVVPNPDEIGSPLDSLKGVQSGQANVQVRVGTTISAPEAVVVSSTTHVAITPQQIGQNLDVTGNVAYSFNAKVTLPPDAVPVNVTVNSITHDSNNDVAWSIREPNQGRINVDPNNPNSIQYIPPAKSGTYHLIATSVYDKGVSAVAQVIVTQGTLDISFQP